MKKFYDISKKAFIHMKFYIQSIYENNYLCPVLNDFIFTKLPNVVKNVAEADCIILVPSLIGTNINKKIFDINKPYVIIDFLEYGISWDSNTMPTHIIGKNTSDFAFAKKYPSWVEFDEFVKSRPPKLYFKRELKKEDKKDNIMPIEYPCKNRIPPLVNKDDFLKRFIDVFFWWGFSHTSRPLLHAEIFKQSVHRNFHILSDWNSYNQRFIDEINGYKIKQIWAPMHIHHTARVSMDKILEWQNRSKITVSLYGHGKKCFRHAECINTIMAKQDDGLSWSHAWKHNENCILLRDGMEFNDLAESLNNSDLFDIYVKCQENLNHYYYPNYINNHILYQIKNFF